MVRNEMNNPKSNKVVNLTGEERTCVGILYLSNIDWHLHPDCLSLNVLYICNL